MRKITCLNAGWEFSKDGKAYEGVTVPHTWNNLDGQDGGADYLRQLCYYKKTLDVVKSEEKVFVEFDGVNHIANVYINGTHLGEHRGGFSTFRYELTEYLTEGENLLEVTAENSEDTSVYPQQADFTFFGGIYRSVRLVEVGDTHFDLMKSGSTGVFVTPKVMEDGSAEVSICSSIVGQTDDTVISYTMVDADGAEVVSASGAEAQATLMVAEPILWNGFENPYMYTMVATLSAGDVILDKIEVGFGIRSYSVDNEKGFILNGEEYCLRGVSRHQDRYDKGWAISNADHEQDLALIKEVGANTIRLAHYQHAQHFYDICDEAGMVLWAEIPFITMFIEGDAARDNTMSQMKELVLQNYNHPAICFWGISNEITIGGESEALEANQKALVELIHEYDTTRLTTLANVSFVDMDSNQNNLTDIVGFNHYFGWYAGELEDNEEWIDEFHEKHPDRPLCISEYGAEGILGLHTDTPECKDYTEEYHAVYHEHMLKIFETRSFIWATYQWNMFDFAADARDEGGVKGRNNKGLVTFERTIKKDAFYLYKAYWNKDEKFVHVAGRRYLDRASETTTIKVYSNESEVTLSVNGEVVGTITGDKIFIFENVKLNMGENTILATTQAAEDEIKLNRVETPNESYKLVEEVEEGLDGAGVKNWFEELGDIPMKLEFNKEYLSIKDTIKEVMAHEEGRELFLGLIKGNPQGAQLNDGMLKMVEGMKVEMILKMAGKKVPKEAKYVLNAQLQKIKK